MEMSDDDFNDHSTLGGRIKLILSRIRWPHVLAGCAVFSFILLAIFVVGRDHRIRSQNSGQQDSDINLNPYAAIKNLPLADHSESSNQNTNCEKNPPGFYMNFEGSPTTGSIFLGLEQAWWDDSSIPIHLKVTKAIINASRLIHSLKGTRRLESIDIETISVSGQYYPVYLPDLKDFKYNYSAQGNFATFYHQPEKLQEVLFFDKIHPDPPKLSAMTTWSIKKDLANLGVNTSVVIDGQKLVDINRPLGVIKLNLDYAWEILENVKGNYDTLAIISCPLAPNFLSGNFTLPPNLKYLNLFNLTSLQTVQIASLLVNKNSLGQLEQFIFYQAKNSDHPNSTEIQLNVQQLPSMTLKKLSLRGLNLIAAPVEAGAAVVVGSQSDFKITASSLAVQELNLEANHLSQGVLDNFEIIFEKVKILGLFNLKSKEEEENFAKILKLLQKVLTMNQTNLEQIWVTGFDWLMLQQNGQQEGGQVVKTMLVDLGVVEGDENFKILKQNSTTFVAIKVLEDEANFERYSKMGFVDLESFERYKKVHA